MTREYKTVGECTRLWVDGFDAIDSGMIEKLMDLKWIRRQSKWKKSKRRPLYIRYLTKKNLQTIATIWKRSR
jgi:hypothetical protein